MEDSLLFQEYGMPIDPRKLPAPEYQAHVAICEGIQESREENNKKAQKQAEKAKQQSP